MNKKAQSISINTIVVAAIALMVLVLVVLIFTQNITNFRRGADSCSSAGGKCILDDDRIIEDDCGGDYQRVTNHACFDSQGDRDPDRVCCISV